MNAPTNTITRDGVDYYLVNTTNGSEVPNGYAMVTSNLRETKGSNIPAAQKHRNIVIKEFSLPEVQDKFRAVLIDKFYGLAKARLDAYMEESNRMLPQVPCSAFTIDALLEYFSQVAVSNRLTGEAVGAWFDTSATGKYIAERCGADEAGKAKARKYRDLFVKTASPNHGINPNTCTTLLATLQEEDKESSIYSALATKWQATITKSQQSEVDSL